MAAIRQLEGLKEVLLNLRAREAALSAGVSRGLRLAGLLLQRESQRLVPVDYGVLKASAYTRAKGMGYDTVVEVGYTANYAIYVHEMIQMKLKGQPRPKPHKGKYWDPQGRAQAKFLEEPFRRLAPEMLRIVKLNSQIK